MAPVQAEGRDSAAGCSQATGRWRFSSVMVSPPGRGQYYQNRRDGWKRARRGAAARSGVAAPYGPSAATDPLPMRHSWAGQSATQALPIRHRCATARGVPGTTLARAGSPFSAVLEPPNANRPPGKESRKPSPRADQPRKALPKRHLSATPFNRDLGLSAHSTLFMAPRAILARNRGGTKYPH